MSRSFERIAFVDMETFWSDDFTLRRMSTSEYIRDSRFAITAVGIQMDDEAHATVYHGRDAKAALEKIDWSVTAFCAHHAQFDGIIMAEYLGIKPCFYMCTIAMARALYHGMKRYSLEAVCAFLGWQAKEKKQGLVNMKGVADMDDLPEDQRQLFIDYTADDVEALAFIGSKMIPHFPPEELQIIDMTIRLFAEPVLEIEEELMAEIHMKEVLRKKDLINRVGVEREDLRSVTKFCELLRERGVEPPMKPSPKQKDEHGNPLMIPALAINDLAFQALQEHPDERVRDLVEARIGVQSSTVESRAGTMAARARVNKVWPVYLNAFGAHTMRFSGGDKVNPQNLHKKSGMRKAIVAPKDHVIVVCDSSNIEARTNFHRAGQHDVLELFRQKKDVYRITGSRLIYRDKAPEDLTKEERFVAKTAVLGLGYGMGAAKFKHTISLGLNDTPKVDLPLEMCQEIVANWRAANGYVKQSWKNTEEMVRNAFFGRTLIEDDVIAYEGVGDTGYIHMPNGLYMRYPEVALDEEGNMSYMTKMGRNKMYGGLLVENIVQCLARCIVAEQMLMVQAEVPEVKIATMSHDEIVAVAHEDDADAAFAKIQAIMCRAPAWAPDLPLASEGGYAREYSK